MMGWFFALLLVLVVCLAVYAIGVYNSCVQKRNNTNESWSNIEVILKQRHDELPKLISTCKQYMKHESGTLEKVIAARNRVQEASQSKDIKALGMAEILLRQSVGGLFALSEKYPDLKADKSFAKLQARVTELETEITEKRELYNENVNFFNTSIQQFPANMIVGSLGFKAFELLHFGEAEKSDVDMDNEFTS
jgi:LemA protein